MLRRVLPPCAALLVCLSASTTHAATYYVSPGGNNFNTGTSPSAAWRDIAGVNARDFGPGDQILFEGGHTFSGTLFFDAADAGTTASPVVVSSYGAGRATIYGGTGRGILGYNTAGFRIANLFIVGAGRDVNTTSGILFFTDLPGDVLLDFLEITNVDAVRFGRYGIEIGGDAGRSGFRNVRITHVIASENGRGGIFTYAQQRAVHRNVYVGQSSAFLNAGFEGLTTNTGNGITLSGVDGGTIERCVAHDNGWRSDASNGPIGIWTFDSNNVVIQFNESFNNKTGGTKDGGGFSLDNSTSNSVLQYNYSHDNAGAGYMLAHKWDDDVHSGNIIRYNISENDALRNQYAALQTWGRVRNAHIIHNTVYLTYAHGAQRGIYVRNRSIETQDPERLSFRNNIIQTKGGAALMTVDATAADNAVELRFEGNLYWSTGGAFKIYWRGTLYSSLAAWRSATGQERLHGDDAGLAADPQLTSPGAGFDYNNANLIHDAWQYRLRATSPAIDAGVDLDALGVPRGGRDYYGAPAVLNRPDVGAHEFHGDCNWRINPESAAAAAGGGSGAIDVSMSAVWGCGWSATTTQPWLGASPEAGDGPGTTAWFALANGGGARSGTIRIADQSFRVAQGGTASPLPPGWFGGDIGNPGLSGRSSSDGATWTLEGAGADVWGTADAFHFVHQAVDGDWEIEARVASVENVHAWTKAGVMIRGSLAAGSAHAAMMVTPGKGHAFQYRASDGGGSAHIGGGSGTAPHFVKLARRGSTVSAYRKASAGASWTHVGDATIDLGSSIYIGLFVSSHDASELATVVFDSVAARTAGDPLPPPLPAGWSSGDIGGVATAGGATHASGTFTVRGSGADIWGSADEFHFAHTPLTGDGEIVARVATLQNRHAWSKAGVMIRESLEPGAPHATMFVSASKGLAFQRRASRDGVSTHTGGAFAGAPRWVRLVRAGNTFTAYESADGASWTLVGADTIAMGATVYAGLAVTSHADGTLCQATFDNVTVTP